MTKNTPEKFAKVIMSELATIHALIEQVQAYEIAQMAEAQGKTRQEVSDVLMEARKQRRRKLYEALLKETEIQERD